MQRSSLLLLTILALSATSIFATTASSLATGELKSLWSTWKQINNKIYSEAEEIKRFAIFVENYFKVISQNAKEDGVKFALNQFGDLTAQEFKSIHTTGLKLDKTQLKQETTSNFLAKVDYEVLAFPDSIDWRAKGAVTPVKNQQQCGSCWAFSSTGALEGLNFLDSGKLLSFSEQQLVDCDTTDMGCNGGLMSDAFEYTAKKGIMTEKEYPYTSEDGHCKYSTKNANRVNSNYKNITSNSVAALKAALVAQPVSIAIEADEDAFQFYSSGVIKSGCGDQLDHGVLAVGYTTIDGEEAFIVKNSWDSTWGEKGYVYISSNAKANEGSGVCGILSMPVVPLK